MQKVYTAVTVTALKAPPNSERSTNKTFLPLMVVGMLGDSCISLKWCVMKWKLKKTRGPVYWVSTLKEMQANGLTQRKGGGAGTMKPLLQP